MGVGEGLSGIPKEGARDSLWARTCRGSGGLSTDLISEGDGFTKDDDETEKTAVILSMPLGLKSKLDGWVLSESFRCYGSWLDQRDNDET